MIPENINLKICANCGEHLGCRIYPLDEIDDLVRKKNYGLTVTKAEWDTAMALVNTLIPRFNAYMDGFAECAGEPRIVTVCFIVKFKDGSIKEKCKEFDPDDFPHEQKFKHFLSTGFGLLENWIRT